MRCSIGEVMRAVAIWKPALELEMGTSRFRSEAWKLAPKELRSGI